MLKAKTPLKVKKPLTSSVPLKSKSLTLKPTKKRLKLEQKSAAQLTKVADTFFSRYIRLRDSDLVDGEWIGTCITCPRKMTIFSEGKWIKGPQNGHMIGRGTHQLRFDEENCNLQCAHCNAWLDKDEMITRYRNAVDFKYGDGTYKRLKAESELEGALKRQTKPELLQIISDSKQQIEFYERMSNA